jgi:hypothetical protein
MWTQDQKNTAKQLLSAEPDEAGRALWIHDARERLPLERIKDEDIPHALLLVSTGQYVDHLRGTEDIEDNYIPQIMQFDPVRGKFLLQAGDLGLLMEEFSPKAFKPIFEIQKNKASDLLVLRPETDSLLSAWNRTARLLFVTELAGVADPNLFDVVTQIAEFGFYLNLNKGLNRISYIRGLNESGYGDSDFNISDSKELLAGLFDDTLHPLGDLSSDDLIEMFGTDKETNAAKPDDFSNEGDEEPEE